MTVRVIPQQTLIACDICKEAMRGTIELHNGIKITKISNIYEDDSGPYTGDSRPIVTSLDLCDKCFADLEFFIERQKGLFK